MKIMRIGISQQWSIILIPSPMLHHKKAISNAVHLIKRHKITRAIKPQQRLIVQQPNTVNQ